MSFESVDLTNATDNERYCIYSNNEASLPLLSSPSVFTPVNSDASLMHHSMNMDMDENRISDSYLAEHGSPILPSPISSSHATSPSSPVPSHRDDPQTDGQKPPTPKYLRTYHPKLNGMILLSTSVYFSQNDVGKTCDKDGHKIPPNSPPPQHSTDDWFPYKNHTQFELANFLYRHNQMSECDTDFLLNLVNALLWSHGDTAPFQNHSDMHTRIDATTLGEAPWEYIKLNYNGPLPEGVSWENTPSWMTEEHEVWFHDPVTLLENLLMNLDFKDKFNYTPYQEHTPDGSHRFCDFMSGNWSWQQAVYFISFTCVSFHLHIITEHHPQRSPGGHRFISCHTHSWQQQNNCFSCHWPYVLLAFIPLYWEHPR